MVNANREKILAGLDKTKTVQPKERIKSGFEAALKTIELMRATFERLPPSDIVSAYVAFDKPKKELPTYLWRKFGEETISCMQDGTHLLAVLWESAWVEGEGETRVKATAAISEDEAMEICAPQNFLRSFAVDEIGAFLVRPALARAA
jgi:hypothetical protein